jgi:hypothetical protein
VGTGDESYPGHRLATLLREAASGRFPPADGETEVVPAPAPAPGDGACVAFTAHSVIALDLDPDEVRARVAQHHDPLAAALAPDVIVWLAERSGLHAGIVDVVLAAPPAAVSSDHGAFEREWSPGDAPVVEREHPRVMRARQRRTDVRVLEVEGGVVTVGRGLAGRWELALELDHPGAGRGRELIAASRALVPPDEPLFAQVSPGNARSLRAFLAAGFRPIGSEVLFHR